MRRNIKRSLTGLDIFSFCDSSPSPVRRKLELQTAESNTCTPSHIQQESISLYEKKTNYDHASSLNTFVFDERDLIESDSDSGSDNDEEETQQKSTSSSYAKRQESSSLNWLKIRSYLRDAVIESECIPVGQICNNCNVESANFRCLRCGIGNFFCETCVASIHSNVCIFHVIEQWKDGMFLPSPIIDRVINPRPWHQCPCMETKLITAICDNGRRHELHVTTCPCEAFPVSLARIRLWPTSSKQPRFAVSFDLLDWMEALLLECQVSVSDFCKALDVKMPKYVIKKDLYPVIIDCFEEYRFMKHELRTLQHICPDRDYGNVCPACPVDDGVIIESFDASFGLPRKKASGSSTRKPLHGNFIFSSQEDIDKFVEEYPTQPISQKDCSDFNAGDALRSKSKFKALDETGVFGRACRHGFPKQFINLKHGERIAYSVWMLKDMLEKAPDGNFDIKVMYDIGCVLAKHLRASGQTDLLSKVSLAVPAFHVYGHKATCQLEYSPRRANGFGLSDGEQLERLWSYLRRFGKMTKEMRPSHRIDVLSDAILYYGRSCKDKLVSGLLRNWKRCADCIEASKKNIDELSVKSNVPLSEAVIEEFTQQERLRICGNEPTTNEETDHGSDSPVESYVDKLRIFYTLRNHMCADASLTADELSAITKKITRLDKELTVVEKKMNILSRWSPNHEEYQKELESKNRRKCGEGFQKIKSVCEERLFLLSLKEKYSDGHALSKRLANQIKKTEKVMKQLLLEYKSSREQLSDEMKASFKELTLDSAKRQETFSMNECANGPNAIPSCMKW
ncbi:uncharacterized protein LOC114542545 [Dendronephthya gigantea]|uniref:uncharacterized protein LOC114542545 n=1 Tax=Dendronephthya gigantea TaxID=151771 RepID=UPI00106C158F|nr:uncharacterized protein LOC114542545 [Dendronephthya gigantea]